METRIEEEKKSSESIVSEKEGFDSINRAHIRNRWHEIPDTDAPEVSDLKRLNRVEIITAIVLYAVLIGIVFFGTMSYGSLKVIFEIPYMIAIGVIGIVAFILCGVFEGTFPETVAGTIIRTGLLMLAWEIPNVITIPLYIVILAISLLYLYYILCGRISAVLLGSISTLCIPFMGIFVIIIIGMLFRGADRKKRRR